MRAWKACRLAAILLVGDASAADATKTNYYGDPFVQVTSAMPSCPVPEGPALTEAGARAEAHWRVERGTSCYQSGRCRLPNAYLYDREIVPRVARSVRGDRRFDDTSVWIIGQRRWVFLQGCVRSAAQATDLENAVRRVDEVEAVVNQLIVGTTGRPPYPVVER